MSMDRVRTQGLFSCLVLAALLVPGVTFSAGEPDLSGKWVIDLDASDEAADVLEPVTRRKQRGGISVGASVWGIPVGDVIGMARGDEDAPGEEPQDEVRRELGKLRRHLTDAVDELTIEQSPELMRVAYDDLGTFIYRTGESVDVGDAVLDAGWRRSVYVIDRVLDGGTEATEEFRLDRSDRLHWTVALELKTGKNVRISRVFDRAAAAG